MNLQLELPSDVRERLISQARASGLSLEDFAQQVLSERAGTSQAPPVAPLEDRAQALREWLNSHSDITVVLPDEAMERESIYGDHGN